MHGAGVRVIVGDQANKTFWEEFLALSPTFDIIIDDGASQPRRCLTTFRRGFLVDRSSAHVASAAALGGICSAAAQAGQKRSFVAEAPLICDCAAGGHTMIQQITTFEALYPSLAPNGVSKPRPSRKILHHTCSETSATGSVHKCMPCVRSALDPTFANVPL